MISLFYLYHVSVIVYLHLDRASYPILFFLPILIPILFTVSFMDSDHIIYILHS